jgi:hypothetical protein
MKRFVVMGVALALGVGGLATQSLVAGAKSAVPLAVPLTGVTVTCTTVSGVITENPGITAAPVSPGSAAFKWTLKAVASGCTATPNSAGVVATIAGAIVTEHGYWRDSTALNRCGAALGNPGTYGGAGGSKIQWISSPAYANTMLPAGILGSPAVIDTTGLEFHWPIATGTFFELGGDYPAPIPCPAGPLPSTFSTFTAPPSTHAAVFLATL